MLYIWDSTKMHPSTENILKFPFPDKYMPQVLEEYSNNNMIILWSCRGLHSWFVVIILLQSLPDQLLCLLFQNYACILFMLGSTLSVCSSPYSFVGVVLVKTPPTHLMHCRKTWIHSLSLPPFLSVSLTHTHACAHMHIHTNSSYMTQSEQHEPCEGEYYYS